MEYEQIEAERWSTLKEARTSMLRYNHAGDNPVDDKPRFGQGRLVHTAVLQPDLVSVGYVVFDGERRGNAWKDFKAAHVGQTILRRDEYDVSMACADAVRAHPLALEYLNLDLALVERPVVWTDPATGLKCKGRPDAVHSIIAEIKTAATVDERLWRAQATRLGYFGQLAFYRRGYRTLTKLSLPGAIVAVELEPPHDIGVFAIDEDSLRVADDEISLLLARVAECRKTGVWPGRYQTVQSLTMPEWARDVDNVSDFDFSEVA